MSVRSSRGLEVRCVVMRGGATRGLFFHPGDLPSDPVERDRALMAAVGGPDPRQVDGIGGADLLLSKVALVWPSDQTDVDVECRFGSVTPGSGVIKYGANCGNLASAVACFAQDEGLVDPSRKVVRVYNTDSGTMMEARVGGSFDCLEARRQGMPPTGKRVELTLLRPAGTAGGALLPTGRLREDLCLPDGRRVSASIVDAGAQYVFLLAADLGIDIAASGARWASDAERMNMLENLRGQAAVLAGLAASPVEALARTPAVPKLALMGPGVAHNREESGSPVAAADVDLVGRIVSSQCLHQGYAVTGAIATVSASLVRGSVVHALVGEAKSETERRLRIGHPSGVLECTVAYTRAEETLRVLHASVWRTARRIMEGRIHIPEARV